MLAKGSFIAVDGDVAFVLTEDLRSGRDLPKGDLADIDCVFISDGERGISGEGAFDDFEDMVAV